MDPKKREQPGRESETGYESQEAEGRESTGGSEEQKEPSES